jgi:hypothetical protein
VNTGFVTISLYLTQNSPAPVIKTLSSALLFIAPCDYLRLRWPGPGSTFAKLYEKCVGFLMRESEKVRAGLLLDVLMLIEPIANHQRRNMVHPRRQLRPPSLSTRHSSSLHPNVRLPFPSLPLSQNLTPHTAFPGPIQQPQP